MCIVLRYVVSTQQFTRLNLLGFVSRIASHVIGLEHFAKFAGRSHFKDDDIWHGLAWCLRADVQNHPVIKNATSPGG